MNKTKIEWCDYTWNPITGCKRGCFFCYGKRIRERFQPDIPWSELIWHDERLEQPLKEKKPSRIFVGSMSDIEFWRHIDVERIIDVAKKCPHHTFMFLTKNAEVYGAYDFPKNCWLGVTATDGYYNFGYTKRLKFISLEPLLSKPQGAWIDSNISWVIIGAMTGVGSEKFCPKKEWVEYIIKECRQFEIPIFIKNNIGWKEKIQEFPR